VLIYVLNLLKDAGTTKHRYTTQTKLRIIGYEKCQYIYIYIYIYIYMNLLKYTNLIYNVKHISTKVLFHLFS